MTDTQDIVAKLWNRCHVLRDDGITYHQYVTELTYLLFLALRRLLEIVGEAAGRVSEPTRALAPGIPWRLVSSTRNRLIHGYFDVDLDVIGRSRRLTSPRSNSLW